MWEFKMEMEKTYNNIKAFFKNVWRKYLNNKKTTKAASFHSAKVTIEEMPDVIVALTVQSQKEYQATADLNANLVKDMDQM